VTFTTYKRQSLLAREDVHEAFCRYCFKAQERDVAVGRYVIMPDHVHLFAAFPIDGITLRSWVQLLRTVMGKTLLRIGIQKPHWQEGFFDHLLRSYESYSQKWEYVRMNPYGQNFVRLPRLGSIKAKLFGFHLPDAGCCSRLAMSRRCWRWP
jgi:putative transposase